MEWGRPWHAKPSGDPNSDDKSVINKLKTIHVSVGYKANKMFND